MTTAPREDAWKCVVCNSGNMEERLSCSQCGCSKQEDGESNSSTPTVLGGEDSAAAVKKKSVDSDSNGKQSPYQTEPEPINYTGWSSSSSTAATNSDNPSPEISDAPIMKRDPRLGPNADEDERKATDEGRKVFVGNLKRPITRQEVIDHFSKFGEVERVILNSGFGLVLMTTREGALKATAERWQALDWRNVEVFVYTKGAKGASWNRPYIIPPRPGACSLCTLESAEHCALCTASLCLNDTTTCALVCHACQRSFCKGGKECGKSDGLDACDGCQAMVCLFCALKVDATCKTCGRPFTDRLKETARARAVRLANSRIADSDGSVYALVCLLKGDLESGREGQLVAAVDRASKCFDPRSSYWCTWAAIRAIKELDEAWEATKRVHNLRVLRRSAKQWSTDLARLTTPHPPTVPQVHQNGYGNQHMHGSNPHMNGSNYRMNGSNHNNGLNQHHNGTNHHTSVFTHGGNSHHHNNSNSLMHSYQQMQNGGVLTPVAIPAAQKTIGRRDMFFAAARACENFLLEFQPRGETEVDWMAANLKNVTSSLTKKKVRFLEDLCLRVEVWGYLLRRLDSSSSYSGFAAMNPLDRLKRAIVELDMFYLGAKSIEDYYARKDVLLTDLLSAARDLKRVNPPLMSAEAVLKRAGRSARNVEVKAMLLHQGSVPFEACLHHLKYRRCSLGGVCQFSHYEIFSFEEDATQYDRDFEINEYEFSNELDELALAVTNSITRSLAAVDPWSARSPPATNGWNYSPRINGGGGGYDLSSPSFGSSASNGYAHKNRTSSIREDMFTMPAKKESNNGNVSSPNRTSMNGYSLPAPGMSNGFSNNGYSNNGSSNHHYMNGKGYGGGYSSNSPTWSNGMNGAYGSGHDMNHAQQQQQESSSFTRTFNQVGDVAAQVATLCQELHLEAYASQITNAFFAAGCVSAGNIWDTDVAALHRELVKIQALPATLRVHIVSLVTERRSKGTTYYSALAVPALL